MHLPSCFLKNVPNAVFRGIHLVIFVYLERLQYTRGSWLPNLAMGVLNILNRIKSNNQTHKQKLPSNCCPFFKTLQKRPHLSLPQGKGADFK